MAFTLPVFNIAVNFWRFTSLVTSPPDYTAMGNLVFPRRVTPGDANYDPNVNGARPNMSLLLPAGTPVMGAIDTGSPDTCEAPAGSGRYYLVHYADNVATSFANAHVCALLTRCQGMPPGPVPAMGSFGASWPPGLGAFPPFPGAFLSPAWLTCLLTPGGLGPPTIAIAGYGSVTLAYTANITTGPSNADIYTGPVWMPTGSYQVTVTPTVGQGGILVGQSFPAARIYSTSLSGALVTNPFSTGASAIVAGQTIPALAIVGGIVSPKLTVGYPYAKASQVYVTNDGSGTQWGIATTGVMAPTPGVYMQIWTCPGVNGVNNAAWTESVNGY